MILIVGLGNPGKEYINTRHNIGFRVVDEFVKRNNFPDFKLSKKLRAKISKGVLDSKKMILAKPQTFMNLSGKAVKKLTYNLQLTTYNLWVIHDDIDLPLGIIRISRDRGAAGHKGIESIIRELKTKDFVRFRIGIQPKSGKPKNIEKFVLKKFNKEEKKVLNQVVKKTTEAIEIAIKEGVEKAMGRFNE